MTRKSKLKEVIARAKHHPAARIEDFAVVFRDGDTLSEIPLRAFLSLSEAEGVPLHRIRIVKERKLAVWVRSGCCATCGAEDCTEHQSPECRDAVS